MARRQIPATAARGLPMELGTGRPLEPLQVILVRAQAVRLFGKLREPTGLDRSWVAVKGYYRGVHGLRHRSLELPFAP